MNLISHQSKQLNILIVGLGKVGLSYDLNSLTTTLTHTKAIYKISKLLGIEVFVCGVDPVADKRKLFIKNYPQFEAYSDLREINNKIFDLAIICCDTNSLVDNCIYISEYFKISKIIIEKPVANNVDKYNQVVKLSNKGIDIRVGFPRRTLPSTTYLKNLISKINGEKLWDIQIYVGGDTLNIGSHFIDLIQYLFGNFNILNYKKCNDLDYFYAEGDSLRVTISQETFQNTESTTMNIRGPLNIEYEKAGRALRIYSQLDQSQQTIDVKNEIENMIGFEAMEYILWALNQGGTILPSPNQTLINQILLFKGNL